MYASTNHGTRQLVIVLLWLLPHAHAYKYTLQFTGIRDSQLYNSELAPLIPAAVGLSLGISSTAVSTSNATVVAFAQAIAAFAAKPSMLFTGNAYRGNC